MFRSVKLKNIRVTVFSLVCLMLFVTVCLLMLRAGAPDTVTIGGESYSLRAEDEGDIAAFIAACGYTVGEPLYEREVTVPKIWNDAYTRYNELQKRQGLDLVPYKGKAATEQSYDCGDRYITVLLSNDRIIAAHVCNADGSGMEQIIMDN